MKACNRCKRRLPLESFDMDRRPGRGPRPHCKECRRQMQRDWRANNVAHLQQKQRERYWANPTAERERHLVRKYGVDLGGYEHLFKEQHGSCAVCGKRQTRAFDVDHCHTTGRVRGLLCTSCNRMIGHAGDSPDRLEAAAGYLRASRRAAKPLQPCEAVS